MTPEETQRQIGVLQGQVQKLARIVAIIQAQPPMTAAQPQSSATVLGDLPGRLKNILNFGFEWVANKANVKAKTGAGITVDSSGVGVKVKSNAGLTLDSNGLAVLIEVSKGLSMGTSGLAAVIKTGGGLGVDAGGLYLADLLGLEKSADPIIPDEGHFIIWMSDGTGKGADGDILIASTAGAVTHWGTLFDHSTGAAW